MIRDRKQTQVAAGEAPADVERRDSRPTMSHSWALDCPSPRPDVLRLCWQTLCLHIIWLISLYFYPADVSPCQQPPPPPPHPDKAKMENPPLFKVLHMKLPSLLSFPLPTPTLRFPWDAVPCPILMVGKHILIDAPACLCVCVSVCVQSLNEDAFRSEAAEQRPLVVLYFFFAVGLMSHLSSKMDRDPGTPPESLAKTLMEGD